MLVAPPNPTGQTQTIALALALVVGVAALYARAVWFDFVLLDDPSYTLVVEMLPLVGIAAGASILTIVTQGNADALARTNLRCARSAGQRRAENGEVSDKPIVGKNV